MALMETLAPAVVAVLVTSDPGEWFEETLGSLAAQDYPELTVLVLDRSAGPGVAERVAATLPGAYVAPMEPGRGFGEAANEITGMVEGASYYLFLHDDVALDPDAVHLLVEEAFRSNGGIVGPKVVTWDDPDRLLHVGVLTDKTGAVVDRVTPGEIDHGQHDAVRDVMAVTGGCVLVRGDLFHELGGFDPEIAAMGEDLDLCWRAQVMGARVIVAPDARVRHRERLASGERPYVEVPDAAKVDPGAGPHPSPSLQELQRRHELYTVLKCTSRAHRWRIAPQAFVLSVGEVVVALASGDSARAHAVVRAWRWVWQRRVMLRRRRAELNRRRRVPDRELRALQIRGSARLSSYARRVFQHGFHGALDDELTDGEREAALVAAASEDHGAPPESRAARRAVLWVAAVAVVVVGLHSLITGPVPFVGQFAPFPSLGSVFHQAFAGWHAAGVGITAPASPAMAAIGVLGVVCIGAMGLAQKVLVLAAIPIGTVGVVRLVRRAGSKWAAALAGVAYLALPLGWNALALGRLDGLAAFAISPWLVARMDAVTHRLPEGTVTRRLGPGTLTRAVLVVGALDSVLVAFAPSGVLVVPAVALALVAAMLLRREPHDAARVAIVAVGSQLVAAALCLPWLVGVLTQPGGVRAVFGALPDPTAAPSWAHLLRFAVGPVGGSALTWGFLAAGALPLLIAGAGRLVRTERAWSIALVCWVLAFAAGRGWLQPYTASPTVLLAPAAVGLAASMGYGTAAFERDLRRRAFGWRQLAVLLAAAGGVVAVLPTLGTVPSGRADLPASDFASTLNWLAPMAKDGSFRVLWLGDPRGLPGASWTIAPGFAFTTSVDGLPDAAGAFAIGSPGEAAGLGADVAAMRAGRTDQLGALLARDGVRYVAVVSALAPELPGIQSVEHLPVPGDLSGDLARQIDLTAEFNQAGVVVYANSDWIPVRASSPGPGSPVAPGLTVPGRPVVAHALSALPAPPEATSIRGRLAAGWLTTAMGPADGWHLVDAAGRTLPPGEARQGVLTTYRVTEAGTYRLEVSTPAWIPAGMGAEFAAWLVLVLLLGRGHRLRPIVASRAFLDRVGRRQSGDDHIDWDPDEHDEAAP